MSGWKNDGERQFLRVHLIAIPHDRRRHRLHAAVGGIPQRLDPRIGLGPREAEEDQVLLGRVDVELDLAARALVRRRADDLDALDGRDVDEDLHLVPPGRVPASHQQAIAEQVEILFLHSLLDRRPLFHRTLSQETTRNPAPLMGAWVK